MVAKVCVKQFVCQHAVDKKFELHLAISIPQKASFCWRELQNLKLLLDGQLRDKYGKAFEFSFYSDRRKNQDRYERLGEV